MHIGQTNDVSMGRNRVSADVGLGPLYYKRGYSHCTCSFSVGHIFRPDIQLGWEGFKESMASNVSGFLMPCLTCLNQAKVYNLC